MEVRDAPRLLDKVEVLALEVLDHRQQAGLLHVHVEDEAGHAREPRQPGRTEAALARDELVAAVVQPHADGREHAVLLYALRKRGEALSVEDPARLVRVRVYFVYRYLYDSPASDAGPGQ